MKTAIITTTINVPVLLEDYIKDGQKYEHDFFFVVIGDKKTPPETKKFCEELKEKYTIEIYCLDVEDQKEYLKKYPELDQHLLYNSIQRRNIGTLLAYEKGADIVITIDDDNYLETPDFIKNHTTGMTKEMEVLSSDTGWLNSCDFLEEEHGRRIYHRGFPLEYRFMGEKIENKNKKIKIVANAGFWLEEPDIDALVRLHYLNKPIVSKSYKKEDSFALELGTWSAFNSQNTALAREIIPAYFVSPYLNRYDDIWGSYVIQKIAEHLGHYVSFGLPIVTQKRNPHNSWHDLNVMEAMGMELNKDFTDMLRKIKLTKDSYQECFAELADELTKEISNKEYLEEQKKFYENYFKGMKVWTKTFERLG